ncbi:AraC family transcriptional regulator [Pleurocapsales cyanobacterium LEGE 06147]|nr:AraC family transcriptional regulator [Pleurocapsales cyanobacterium LEGE 06147]
MAFKKSRESVSFWRSQELGNLELLRATYLTHSFPRHMHEGFAIGVIEKGVEAFTYKETKHFAPAGSLVVINPGEVHTGYTASEMGCTYRAMYADATLLRRAASETADRQRDIPFFSSPVIKDRQLAQFIFNLHISLKRSTSRLEQESSLMWTLGQLIVRQADSHFRSRPIGQEHWRVKQIREYLESHYAENVSLECLSRLVNLSSFHLIRVFQKEVGLPPHAYLNQIRVMRAKKLLALGHPIAEVASETGFVDQSHFTRHFKRLVGLTPKRYMCGSKNVQD